MPLDRTHVNFYCYKITTMFRLTWSLFVFSLLYCCFLTACNNTPQEQAEVPIPLERIFSDVVSNIATDSFRHHLGTIEPKKFYLHKRFQYLGDSSARIQSRQSSSTHFIHDYPKGLLQPDSVYQLTIYFDYSDKIGWQHSTVRFRLDTDELCTFAFKAEVVADSLSTTDSGNTQYSKTNYLRYSF